MKFDPLPVPRTAEELPSYLRDNFRRLQDLLVVEDRVWTDWTPELLSTGGAVGYGTGTVRSGRYRMLGVKTVLFRLYIQLGTGMSLPAGTYYGQLPVAPAKAAPPTQPMLAMFYDASSGLAYSGTAGSQFGGVSVNHWSIHMHGQGAFTTSTPVVWGVNDQIMIQGTYELE